MKKWLSQQDISTKKKNSKKNNHKWMASYQKKKLVAIHEVSEIIQKYKSLSSIEYFERNVFVEYFCRKIK